MAPTLDHTSYPDLMDAIIAHSDFGALLALRAASRAYRDRVDALLLSDVGLAPAKKAHFDPSWPSAWPALVIEYDGRVLPLPPSAVYTLTIPRGTVPADAGNDLLDKFTALRVLRLTEAPDTFYPVADTVVYAIPMQARGTMDAEARRVVLHVALDGTDTSHVDVDAECSVLDLVLWRKGPDIPLYAVCSLVLDMLFVPGRTNTVVGASELWVGVGDDDAARRLLDAVRAQGQQQGIDGLLDGFDDRLDAVRFVSHSQWFEELGDDRQAVGDWVLGLPL
ncbi:uncharacterized protein LOC62_04G005282 [Vanrija pseudolonga]|uniref:Uncharacterized protein n=1 Tax=Vanrija pseudolonga TaxID=143232 RepID=A0AAF1BI09_9TREE|nr:hypothetical protein LOC62_04G005282 [Vanrija pseudolonga]